MKKKVPPIEQVKKKISLSSHLSFQRMDFFLVYHFTIGSYFRVLALLGKLNWVSITTLFFVPLWALKLNPFITQTSKHFQNCKHWQVLAPSHIFSCQVVLFFFLILRAILSVLVNSAQLRVLFIYLFIEPKYFFFFYWSIVSLQCCVNFYCTMK